MINNQYFIDISTAPSMVEHSIVPLLHRATREGYFCIKV